MEIVRKHMGPEDRERERGGRGLRVRRLEKVGAKLSS